MARPFQPLLDPPDDLSGPALWFCVGENAVLLRTVENGAELLTGAVAGELGVETGEAHFLGVLDGQPCWSVEVSAGVELPPDLGYVDLMALYGQVDERTWAVAGRAVQLVEWSRTHRYCGRCGEPTEPAPGERARRCRACGLLAFPRLAPAVIVAVTKGDEILLARNARFPVALYSVLAGFVEPGETIEETVHREVEEETGVTVNDIRYFASQPWPFPHSLMLGFTASWAAGEIVIDETELADAGWFRADALPMIPPPLSIARRLIDHFVETRV